MPKMKTPRMRSALLVLIAGCSLFVPKKPIPVAIVMPIPGTRPTCVLEDVPTPPDFLSDVGSSDNPDVIDRVMVHRRDYYNMIQFAHEVATWIERAQKCLHDLSQDTPP